MASLRLLRVARWFRLPLFVLALALGLSTAGLLDRVFFLPTREVDLQPPPHLEVVTDTFPSLDGTELARWTLPAEGRPKAIVLQVHGNAMNLGAHIWAVEWLPSRQIGAIAFDYRGYGRSEGSVWTRRGPVDDTRAALREARHYALEQGLPLFVLGQSIGGNLALAALAKDGCEGIAGVILDSTFFSWRRVAADRVGSAIAWLVRDGDSARDTFQKLPPELPVLILHGDEDSIVGVDHSRSLMKAAALRPAVEGHLLPGLEHLEPLGGMTGRRLLLDFIDRNLQPVPPF